MKLSQFIIILQDTAAARARDGVVDPLVLVRVRHNIFFTANPFNPRDYNNVFIELGEYVETEKAIEGSIR